MSPPPGREWAFRRCARGPRAWAARSLSTAGPARGQGLWSVFLRGTVLQLLDVYDALPDGVDHRLGPIEDVQLPVDVGGVVVYRLLRNAQRVSYLPVALALSQSPYDLQLSISEGRHQPLARRALSALEGV